MRARSTLKRALTVRPSDAVPALIAPYQLLEKAGPDNDLNFAACQQVEASLDRLFSLIPELSADELFGMAAYAERLGVKAYLLRGACALKLLAAAGADPLPGGRHCKDTEGRGRQAQLSRLAARIRVNPKTLKTDARIYDTFFRDYPNGKTKDARILSLPRELFVIALVAPDPLGAIEFALARAGQNSFGRRQFREYVQGLIPADGTAAQKWSLKKRAAAPPKRLSPEAESILAKLQKLSGQDPAEILAEALRRHYDALRRNLPKRQLRTGEQARQRGNASADAADLIRARKTKTLAQRQPSLF